MVEGGSRVTTSPRTPATREQPAAGEGVTGPPEDNSTHEATNGRSGSPERETRTPRRRLASLDAVRGLAIVIMLLAGSPFMRGDLPDHLKHPEWHGLRFADLFFPLFLFVVGVAMTMSRRASSPRLVLRRVLLLALIGVVLSSIRHGGLVLPGVLQHIAGSYLIAWLVLQTPRRVQPAVTAGLLCGILAGYLLWPGAADPWGEEGTFAHAVNGWLLGGFATEGVLQTATSAVTVLGGALIGRGVKEREDPRDLYRWVAVHAGWLIVLALLLAIEVPINKRLWTPSFTLLTIGTSCAWFALFIWLIDVRGVRRWSLPMQELGANPIAIYVGFITIKALISPFNDAVPHLEPFGNATAGALAYSLGWLILGLACAHLLFRRKIFLKI